MTAVAVIPARGGSVRIPRKNIKDFHGKPIIAYSIEAAKATGLFDHIYVSTDDAVIAGVAEHYGAEVWFRDKCDGTAGTQEVTAECLRGLGFTGSDPSDVACCIYATAPLMAVGDLELGFLKLGDENTFCFSVSYPPLQDAAQFYWGWIDSFIDGEWLVSTATRLIHIDPSRVCDINTLEDWARAEAMYLELNR